MDYKLKPDGFVEQTEEGKKKGYSGDTTGQWVTGTFDKYLRAKVSGIPSDVFEANKKLIDSISSIPDPTYGLMNSTPFKEKGADWNKTTQASNSTSKKRVTSLKRRTRNNDSIADPTMTFLLALSGFSSLFIKKGYGSNIVDIQIPLYVLHFNCFYINF
ncbi:hypothetical protein HQN89_11525 [Paenibacillus frigoriresistens]|uniref:hypothetical protein n=1 Tax=Paenibacillus alginolyticus TaxID=59839 RepID=UPI001566E4DD|nr:hypothetical protein [Paenibacillus frigoriresistens]NRF91646.1 hypothetical protein [Paenibacillus frigoriresistens]